MTSRLPPALALAALALVFPPAARSALPTPLDPTIFDFPGSNPGPFSAASTGVALADHWLGDDPAGNPAARTRSAIAISPVLLRVSRQDLAAENNHFDQQAAFLDAAGAELSQGAGSWGIAAYLYEPVLRREDNAFERGELDGPVPPAEVRTDVTAREWRGGLAFSWGRGVMRIGAAGEWTRRDDAYHTFEQSGAPDAGDRRVTFSGDGFGGQAGVRLDLSGPGGRDIAIGASARYVPSLSLEGTQTLRLGTGDSTGTVSAERDAGWEGGFSARMAMTPSFRVLAGAGGRTAVEWSGFDVRSGREFAWSVAMDYHDPLEPWTVRFGIGRERQWNVPEYRAGRVAIGFGWRFSDAVLDLGVARRSLTRADRPRSFDDRLTGTLTVPF
jgi:hypothetical protein